MSMWGLLQTVPQSSAIQWGLCLLPYYADRLGVPYFWIQGELSDTQLQIPSIVASTLFPNVVEVTSVS